MAKGEQRSNKEPKKQKAADKKPKAGPKYMAGSSLGSDKPALLPKERGKKG